MLRIGEINYLNCLPLFTALRKGLTADECTFEKGYPALLNSMLRSGEIDICPSSSIEFGRNPDDYLVLPELSIAADGRVQSVLLFSRKKIEELDDCSIAVTGESETSVVLLKILLTMKYSFASSYNEVGAMGREALAGNDALLLIGDRALQESRQPFDGFIYDLGELWQQFTGLPFVFALWLLRREAFERDKAGARGLHKQLLEAKISAVKGFETVADDLSQAYSWIGRDGLVSYWRTISYDLGARELKGLKLFYRYAVECGLLDKEPEINLL